ncbi:hypothetical protein [Nonomuraea sp. NPDC049784]|uniref:hypothetical protein n=1 Tax=Nonomuraea sp. NPDC049784 TaxID=3154361 RepID=UPI003406BAFF
MIWTRTHNGLIDTGPRPSWTCTPCWSGCGTPRPDRHWTGSEYIASFYLLDCESEERAHEIAADMPWADLEPVEVWPILHESAADL